MKTYNKFRKSPTANNISNEDHRTVISLGTVEVNQTKLPYHFTQNQKGYAKKRETTYYRLTLKRIKQKPF